MTVRRLLMPLTLLTMTAFAGGAVAQQPAFPAPLPGQAAAPAQFPPVGKSAAPAQTFPPVSSAPSAPPPQVASPSAFPAPTSAAASQGVFQPGGGFPGMAPQRPSAEQEECMAKFTPLRTEAEKRAKAIQAASARKATAQDACNLIKLYVAAEKKVVDYVTTKQTACNIPAEVPKQLKENQSRSAEMLKTVCTAAANQAQGGGAAAAAPSLSEVLGTSSNASIETRTVRKGGSTFDTINGNVLSR